MSGEFDLSARITADATGLVQGAAQGEAALDSVASATRRQGAASREAAAGDRILAGAQEEVARSARERTNATEAKSRADTQAELAAIRLATAEAKLANAENATERSAAAAALAALRLQQAQARLNQEQDRGIRAAGNQSYAIRNVGQQFGDFGLQVAGGADIARAFGQQAGQLGFALSDMEGRLGSVGKFLVGPWGIALTVAAAVVAPLIEKLFQAGDAADEQAKKLDAAASAADSYGNAQSLLGRVIDLTTGKLKTQNRVLIETIRLQAQLNLLDAQKRIDDASPKPGAALVAGAPGTGIGGLPGGNIDAAARANRYAAEGQKLLDLATRRITLAVGNDALAKSDPQAYSRDVGDTLGRVIKQLDRVAVGGKIANRNLGDVKLSLIQLANAGTDKAAALESITALAGGKVADDLKPYKAPGKPKKGPKPKKAPSTEGRDEFGRDAGDRIANIVGQFDETPSVIDKTNAKIRELDDLIEDLGRKRPPGFEGLIAAAENAKEVVRSGLIREVARAFEEPKTLAEKGAAAVAQLDAVIADLGKRQPPGFEKLIGDARTAEDVIRNGLQKPYRDFVEAQQAGLEVGRLTLAGRLDEAEALRQIQALEKNGPRLTLDQRDAVLATVQALRAQSAEIERARAASQKYLEAVGGIKGAVEDATQAFVRGDLGQFLKTPGKLLDVFQTLQGRAIFDKLFGQIFRDLEDQVNGTTTVKDASAQMAAAVRRVSTQTDVTTGALDRLAGAANRAASAQAAAGGTVTPPGVPAGAGGLLGAIGGASLTAALSAAFGGGKPGQAGGAYTDPATGDIVVTPNRLPTAPTPIVPSQRPTVDVFGQGLGRIATSITGLFTNKENAARIGTAIGNYGGKAFAGAATGSLVSGIGSALGIKNSKVGAQIGGAIGNLLPIPGGSIIGSIAGGLLGGLLAPKAKPGGATVSAVNGSAGVSGTVGSDKAGIAAGKGLAGSVASGINSIAQQLGGSLGSFSVSIGKYKNDLRVNTNGKALGGVKGSGATGFGDDEAAAVSFAISQAIAQGAVTGLSAAVQKALASSTDVDKALAEALKVREVETLIGGLGASLRSTFEAFDRTAADRLRIAQSYGLDVAKVEKLNAEQRVKLVDDTLKARVGSLADFLQSVKFGDLFEGSAADRRVALKAQIATVQADAEAGKDGAADKLAALEQQLFALSREAFGTAGNEYADDRASGISVVERVIAMETDRVNAAAAGTQQLVTAAQSTAAGIAAGNALTAETNDLIARQTAAVLGLDATLQKLGVAPSAGLDLSAVARVAKLSVPAY